jgi:hypothetical protein
MFWLGIPAFSFAAYKVAAEIQSHGFSCDRWSPLLRGFHERKVQFVCIPFLRIEWVAVRIFTRCNHRSYYAKIPVLHFMMGLKQLLRDEFPRTTLRQGRDNL